MNYLSNHNSNLQDIILRGSAPDVVEEIISIATKERASDIHIEPMEQKVRVRIRVDGTLHKLIEYARPFHASIVARLKVLCNMKIDEQRKPQDGRISIKQEGMQESDLRISTFPTIYGEKIVMRIVDKTHTIPALKDLGLEGRNLEVMEKTLARPNGVILTTGPTGSGKSTTLYSCLQSLNSEDVNILTLEDPVEIQVPGLNQSQMHTEIGYNFAWGLRNSLRQDPDIMMVGEIRDKETLETAIEAALTGHLVFSTLHTNSAIETINRLLNMQIARYLISATVQIILAQRLARKICTHCSTREKPSEVVKQEIMKIVEQITKTELLRRVPDFHPDTFQIPVKGPGCVHCNGVGYRGRVALYEIVEFTETFQEALLQELPTPQLKAIAKKEGTLFLREDGIIRVLQGMTTLEEIYAKT